jgi:hypothetical protein
MMSNVDAWRALLGRIVSRGKQVFDKAPVSLSDKGTKDPKVWALALLARTVGNIDGAILLLDAGHVIEARTLIRCAYENFFCAAAIVKTGDNFIKTMELDDAASRRKQAKRLLDWAAKQDQPLDFAEKLAKFAAALDTKHPKAPYLNHQKTAESGTIADAYIFYNVLSNDAAHPSATSLSRYITWNGDDTEWTLSAFPADDLDEIDETLELACGVMLGVTVAVNEAVAGGNVGENLFELSDDFKALSNASKVARDNRAA